MLSADALASNSMSTSMSSRFTFNCSVDELPLAVAPAPSSVVSISDLFTEPASGAAVCSSCCTTLARSCSCDISFPCALSPMRVLGSANIRLRTSVIRCIMVACNCGRAWPTVDRWAISRSGRASGPVSDQSPRSRSRRTGGGESSGAAADADDVEELASNFGLALFERCFIRSIPLLIPGLFTSKRYR